MNSNQPEILGPVPTPRKKGKFWKVVGLLCLVSIAGGVGIAKFTKPGQETTNLFTKYAGPIIAAKQDPYLLFNSVGTVDGHVNVLLVGRDRNWKQGKVYDPKTKQYRPYQVEDDTTRPRSDTMIVASFDRNSNKVRLISIPRDTRVRYTDFEGRKHSAGKLNAVYAEPDGDKLLVKVFQDELGVRIDKVAQIKLDGFTKLIDRVGGLDINVEGALFKGKRKRMKYEDKWGGWKVDLMPGMQHLDGEQAHGYVRFRMDNEGDPGRVRRQQQVMKALVKKMMTVGVTQVPGLVSELQKLFVTDMTDEEVVGAAMFARSLNNAANVTPLTPYGTYQTNGDIKLNRPENEKLFTAIFGGSFNPKNFLVQSPETTGDDIGSRNNNNPSALAVLREAGLIEKKTADDAKIEAPGLQ